MSILRILLGVAWGAGMIHGSWQWMASRDPAPAQLVTTTGVIEVVHDVMRGRPLSRSPTGELRFTL